ncbi:glycosyltransferase [Thiohalobacter sp. IOR34]|uniref:glycosyltransferase n=1 Tax=Thiohalobacter sp. IOR34 TaxID=3057176 RepID=UPI00339D4462
MRILHVYRTYFPDTQGGLEESIRQICRSTGDYGAECRIFTLSRTARPREILREEARVFRRPLSFEVASCGFGLTSLPTFNQLVTWSDLVHYHYPWPFADILHLLGRVSKPSVVTYHSDIVRQRFLGALYMPLRDRFLSSMDRIVATSPNYFATSNTLGRFSEKVEVIPLGVDDASYPSPDEGLVDRMRHEVGEGFFLFIGVLRYYKGLHVLLDAMKGAAFRLIIVGAGPVKKALLEQAKRLGLDNVRFLGRITDEEKVALIKLSKAIVFPSLLRAEAFGITLVEGAMLGKPLISTEMGTGTSYVNADGESGIVVPPANPAALRQAMEKLASDPPLAERMGQAARLRYESYFTARRMGQAYMGLYENILKQRHAG